MTLNQVWTVCRRESLYLKVLSSSSLLFILLLCSMDKFNLPSHKLDGYLHELLRHLIITVSADIVCEYRSRNKLFPNIPL